MITVNDYAAFLISAMNGDGYGAGIRADRDRVHVSKGDAYATVNCEVVASNACPVEQGYGLGWEVLDYGDFQIISHGGSDWHELAIVYFDTQSKDGVIIFLNAPNLDALRAMPAILEVMDGDSPFIEHYRGWLALAEASQAQ